MLPDAIRLLMRALKPGVDHFLRVVGQGTTSYTSYQQSCWVPTELAGKTSHTSAAGPGEAKLGLGWKLLPVGSFYSA